LGNPINKVLRQIKDVLPAWLKTAREDYFLKNPITVAGIIARIPMIAAPIGQAGWPQQGQLDVVIKRPEKADQLNRNRHPLLKRPIGARLKGLDIWSPGTGRTNPEEKYLMPLSNIPFWRSLFAV